MANFSIGLSGLNVVQRAIELIGTNITNATTEGYHSQEAVIVPVNLGASSNTTFGGAEISYIRRNIDRMLDLEILGQRSGLGQTTQELGVLQTIESIFGQLDSQDLSAALSDFYGSLTELSSQPDSLALQNQAVWTADSLAAKFRDMDRLVSNVQEQMYIQASELAGQANDMAAEIGQLNGEISSSVMRGGNANMLRDRRDQLISDLSELLGIRVDDSANMIDGLNVTVWGRNLVTQTRSAELGVGYGPDGQLGLFVSDSFSYSESNGGKLGAIFALANGTLSDVSEGLSKLATDVMSSINQLHVQGVGSQGSFTELTGTSSPSGTLDTWPMTVTAGTINVRIVNTATGEATRQAYTVNPAVDTLASVSAWFDSLGNISSSIAGSALRITAAAGYKFDFLPTMMSEPATSAITGTAEATIGGAYTGSTNQTFTATVAGSGEVGVSGGLVLSVVDASGDIVTSVNVGAGYAPGDEIDIGNGIKVRLSVGTLDDGDEFTVDALARTDTSGFLAAAGVNTLFTGSSASNMNVRAKLLDDPRSLAVSTTADGTNSVNAVAMGALGETASASLGGDSTLDYFRAMRTEVGQAVLVNTAKKDSQESVLRQLTAQRTEISGVDINEEAAKLVVYERMYQAISKSISAQDQALKYLFDMMR